VGEYPPTPASEMTCIVSSGASLTHPPTRANRPPGPAIAPKCGNQLFVVRPYILLFYAILVNLVLSAAAHFIVVERAVSHYNIFRNDKRLSMSLQTVNDRLLIAQNGNGTDHFDPRPAVANFLCSKQRRYREPKLETYSSRPFIKKIFRTDRDSLT